MKQCFSTEKSVVYFDYGDATEMYTPRKHNSLQLNFKFMFWKSKPSEISRVSARMINATPLLMPKVVALFLMIVQIDW
jgi:hypothetical protein